MTTTEIISPDLKTILRRLRLSRILDTLPERLVLARQQKMPYQDWLLLILSDEATRRDSLAVTLRVQKAALDPRMHWEAWDPSAKVTFDRALDLLERAAVEREVGLNNLGLPVYNGLRGHPRFIKLVRRVGLLPVVGEPR
jgi:hypothetical protein